MQPHFDLTQRFVDWILRNTKLVALLLIGVLVGGTFSLLSLQRQGFPSADINVAVITTVYRGASAQEVEKQIIKPIEQAAQQTRGFQDINSTAQNNFGVVSVVFTSGTDFNTAISELRSKVQSLTLPTDSERPTITIPEFGGSSSFYALSKKTEATTDTQLRQAADTLRAELEAVTSVQKVTELLEPKYSVAITWDAAKLARAGVSPVQLQQALQTANLSIPSGGVTLNDTQVTVVTSVKLTSLEDVQKVVVGATPQGLPVRVSDIATVSSYDAQDRFSTNVGLRTEDGISAHQALLFKVDFKKSADVLGAEKDVTTALARATDQPAFDAVTLSTASNAADSVRNQINEVVSGAIGGPIGTGPFANLGYLLGGIWIIILVMLVFVNWRAAIVSSLAIPLSILITLLVLKLQGINLNTLTLFSMVLVLGLVVDPAVVVVEAIQRELDAGEKPRDAVMKAIGAIGGGVLMATITNFIVFVPFAIVSGVFGQIIKYIPLTVIPAMVASYFVPLVFLTFLSERLLRRDPKHKTASEDDLSRLWKISSGLVQMNKWIQRRWYVQVPIIFLALAIPLGVTGALFATKKVVQVDFSAPIDSDTINVAVEYPSNASLQEKQRRVAAIEPILQKNDSVESYYPLTQGDSGVTFTVVLVDASKREVSPKITEKLSTELEKITDKEKKVYYTAKPVGTGTPQADYPVSVQIYGDDLVALKKAAIATGDILRDTAKFPKVTRVEDGFTDSSVKQIEVTVDRDKALTYGLSPVQVAQTMAGLLGDVAVGSFDRDIDGKQRLAKMYLKAGVDPSSFDEVKNLVIAATAVGPVRLSDVAQVTLAEGFNGIRRINGSRFVTVQAKVVDATKDQTAPQQAIKDYWTKSRLEEYGLRPDALQDKGSENEFKKSFKDLFAALGIAILLTYVALVIFFKSFTQPLAILFALPLGMLGVFPSVALVGGQFGFLEILGIIVLVGIAENVAIFLIDLANRRVAAGSTPADAISEATGLRFRPIFLTTIVSLAGLLPLMILSPFWRSLAAVVSSGILFSSFLSLITTPILYTWFIHGKQGSGKLGTRMMRGIQRAFTRPN